MTEQEIHNLAVECFYETAKKIEPSFQILKDSISAELERGFISFVEKYKKRKAANPSQMVGSAEPKKKPTKKKIKTNVKKAKKTKTKTKGRK